MSSTVVRRASRPGAAVARRSTGPAPVLGCRHDADGSRASSTPPGTAHRAGPRPGRAPAATPQGARPSRRRSSVRGRSSAPRSRRRSSPGPVRTGSCSTRQHGLYDDATMVATLAALAGPAGRTRAGRSWSASRPTTPPGSGGPSTPGRPASSCRWSQDEHEALAAARACRYPPDGGRSWGVLVRRLGHRHAARRGREPRRPVRGHGRDAVGRRARRRGSPPPRGSTWSSSGRTTCRSRSAPRTRDLLADRSPDGPLGRVVRACRAGRRRRGGRLRRQPRGGARSCARTASPGSPSCRHDVPRRGGRRRRRAGPGPAVTPCPPVSSATSRTPVRRKAG